MVSKREEKENIEYLVGFNNTKKARVITVKTSTKDAKWLNIYGKTKTQVSSNQVRFAIPALSTIVLKADRSPNLTEVKLSKLTLNKDPGTGFYQLSLDAQTSDLAEAKFYRKLSGTSTWELLGQDSNYPFYHYLSANTVSNSEFKAVVTATDGSKAELLLTN